MIKRTRYNLIVPASYLPEKFFRWIGPKWPWRDPEDGWNFWIDASYYKWCRKDRKGLIDHER